MTVDLLLHWIRLLLAGMALLVVAAPILLVLSFAPWGLRAAAEMAKFDRLLNFRRLRRLTRLFRWPLRVYGQVYARLTGSGVTPVRLVVDERLRRLKDTLLAVRDAIREACQHIEHLGKGGHAALEADVHELDRRSQDLAGMGGAIDEDLVKDYEGRTRSTGELAVAVGLMSLFVVANGAFLNLFFQSWIPNYILGIPASLPASMSFVGLEIGLGWLIARNTSHDEEPDRDRLARWVFISLVGLFALIEGFAMGTLSASWDWDLSLFNALPWTRYWMAVVGLVLVPITTGVGFQFHAISRERAKHAGALRLRREIKAANAYVDALPTRWEKIRDRANAAESAIRSYADALGTKASGLKGSVDRIKTEREAFMTAAASARIDEWGYVLEGNDGDRRLVSLIDFGLFLAAAVVATAYVAALGWLLIVAFARLVPIDPRLWFGVATVATVGIAGIGFLPFGRLQFADTPSGRTYPLRTGPGEYTVAAVAGSAAILALIAIGMTAFGWKGAFLGLLFVVGGALLVLGGYYLERIMHGLVSGLAVSAAASAAAVTAGAVLLAHLVAWPVSAFFWVAWALLWFLGRPAEWVWRSLAARRRGTSPAESKPVGQAA